LVCGLQFFRHPAVSLAGQAEEPNPARKHACKEL
jgi:hypothetical protein